MVLIEMQAIFMLHIGIWFGLLFRKVFFFNFNQPYVMVRNIDLIFQSTTQIPISLGSDLLKIESISGSYLLTYLLLLPILIITTAVINYSCD